MPLRRGRLALKRLVLYPFLFAAYAVCNLLAANLGQVDPALAIRPLTVLLLGAGAVLLLFYALTRNWQYSGYLSFLLLFFFLGFGQIYRVIAGMLVPEYQRTAGWILMLALGAFLGFAAQKRVWERINRSGWITPAFNLIFAVALAFPLVTVLAAELQEPPEEMEELLDTGNDLRLDCSQRPDIYYIVLDAYGRSDVLSELYGVDNGAFLRQLEDMGFYIAGESHTNYIQTVFAIPAALNFDYLEPPESEENGQEYFTGLVRDNRLMQALKRCGYRTVAFESGFSFTNSLDADVYLSSASPLNELESLLVADSPLDFAVQAVKGSAIGHSYVDHRQRVLYTFNRLGQLSRMRGPKVVFAHILSPHPPFVFDRRGRPVEIDRSYSIGDGDDYEGSIEEYRQGYAEQVQFVNRKLLETVETILRRSPEPPVIILQGDHGPGSGLDWGSAERTCLWERTGILNAYYLPHGGEALLYPSISPVNSFRVVLNAYFDAGLELLPDETYFTSHRLPGQMTSITDMRDARQNCGLPESVQGEDQPAH